jgi:Arc/MetJ-type ribon-helix-helix transcriptional regulator
MSAKPEEPREPTRGRPEANRPALRAASLSALEEALRLALESATREQVMQRIVSVLPAAANVQQAQGLGGRVQKVSVSMPAELTEAVRNRTGAGGFSHYVSEAVQARIRHDLLGDLLDELDEQYGPVPDEIREKTRLLWPDQTP